MASELLKKEEEYRKLNAQLEMKSKEIMHEADTVMDNLLKDTYKIPEFLRPTKLTASKPLEKLDRLGDNSKNDLSRMSQEPFSDANIPDSVNEMGVKGMNQFFRAKIRAMQVDHDRLMIEYKSKCEELKKTQKEVQTLREDKEKWFHLSTSNKSTMGKLENQISSLSSRVQSKENENIALRKEIEQLKKDVKTATLSLNTTEVRLNRAIEETEKVKSAWKASKQEEKEIKDSYRKQINDLNTVVKKIEKHKSELLCGFKKQLQLIDNLKRQKACLEAFKVAEVAESDFMKIIDCKIED